MSSQGTASTEVTGMMAMAGDEAGDCGWERPDRETLVLQAEHFGLYPKGSEATQKAGSQGLTRSGLLLSSREEWGRQDDCRWETLTVAAPRGMHREIKLNSWG